MAHRPVFAVTLPDGASPRSLTAQASKAYLHLSTLQCTWSGADCFPLQDIYEILLVVHSRRRRLPPHDLLPSFCHTGVASKVSRKVLFADLQQEPHAGKCTEAEQSEVQSSISD